MTGISIILAAIIIDHGLCQIAKAIYLAKNTGEQK